MDHQIPEDDARARTTTLETTTTVPEDKVSVDEQYLVRDELENRRELSVDLWLKMLQKKVILQEMEMEMLRKREMEMLQEMRALVLNIIGKRLFLDNSVDEQFMNNLENRRILCWLERMLFGFDGEDGFKRPCFRNAGDDHRELLVDLCQEMLQEQRVLMPNTTRKRLFLDNYEPFYRRVIIHALGMNPKLHDSIISFIRDKYDENMQRDPLLPLGNTSNQHKRMKTAEHVSSFVMAAIVLLWIFFDICSHSSMIQLLPLHKQLAPVWFPLLELLGFVLFVLAIGTMILIGGHITRLQRAMLMCWAILLLVRSVDSLTVLYVSIIGIIVMGWYMLMEKQPPNEGTRI